jgi:error-prone DNA polymerase
MGFYSPRQLVDDLRRHGGDVQAVDVCYSDRECTLEKTGSESIFLQPASHKTRDGFEKIDSDPVFSLRLGLQQVKGLSRNAAERLVEARNQRPFRDITDLARRARLNRGDLEALAAANALASLAGHRHQARWACAGIEPARPLLEDSTVAEAIPLLKAPGEGEQLVADYASTGLSLGRHPLALLRSRLTRLGLQQARHLRACLHGSIARTSGIVTGRQSPGSASGVMFVTLEDETGITQIIVWPQLAQRQRCLLLSARLLAVEGEVQREGDVLHLIARRLEDHSHLLGRLVTQSRDFQ